MGSSDRSTRIIRAARPDDLDDLVRVNFVAFRAGNGPALSPEALAELTVDAVRARWRRFLDHRPEGVTVTGAELDGRLCGFAGAGPLRDDDVDPSVGELYSLYVDPELWSQGHGTALHEAAMLELVRGGFASAALWVLEGNTRATRFYHAHGWASDGARRPFMGATLLRLTRVLTGERPRRWDQAPGEASTSDRPRRHARPPTTLSGRASARTP